MIIDKMIMFTYFTSDEPQIRLRPFSRVFGGGMIQEFRLVVSAVDAPGTLI